MPMRPLPDHKTQCVISDHGGDYVVFEGKSGTQNIDLYSPIGDTQILYGASPGGYNHHYPKAMDDFKTGYGTGTPTAGINMTTGLDFNMWVGGHRHVGVGADDQLFVQGYQDEQVMGYYDGWVHGYYDKWVTDNYLLKIVSGNYKLDIVAGTYTRNTHGNDETTVADGHYKLEVNGDIKIHSTGNVTMKGDKDKKEFWTGSKSDFQLGNFFKLTIGATEDITIISKNTVVVGLNISVVLGGNVSFTTPINTGIVAGLNMPITIGTKLEFVVGNEIKTISGVKIENSPLKATINGGVITFKAGGTEFKDKLIDVIMSPFRYSQQAVKVTGTSQVNVG
jgi:hypothetical protein